uniref:Major facilitator superfamily (MFS) profile domain-containing protein n=1 Tax=Piliocolobus tephrosceles TaxID=591936 RepID=A0A8C9LHH1_9PRIM
MFSLLQFIGSIFFGRLADIWGVKQSYYLSLCSSSIMYLMLMFCKNTSSYYISFLPAFFIQTFQVSSLLVCLKTDEENRTAAIGYLNLSYGIGIILGSLFAGIMVNYLGSRGNLIIALMSQLVALYVIRSLKEDPKFLKSSNKDKINIKNMFRSIKYEYKRIIELFKKTYGICLLIIFGLLPILMTKFAFAPIVVDMFKLTPSHTSYLMTYAGVITIFAEGILAPYLSSILGDMVCCKFSIPLTLSGFLLLSLCGSNEYLVVLLMAIPLCGGALLYICGTSQMTKRVEETELGTAIGLNTSIFYAVTIIAPYLAFKTYLLLGLGLYWLMCAFICILLTAYIFLLDASLFKIFDKEKEGTDHMFSDITSIL